MAIYISGSFLKNLFFQETATQIPKNILHIRNDRLGDFLLNLPAIHALKQRFPESKISVVINPEIKDLFLNHPDIDELIPFSQNKDQKNLLSWVKLCRQLSKYKFDLAIIANPHKYFHLLCYLLRIPIRVGYQRKWPFLLTHSIPDRKHLAEKHEIEYNLDLVSLVGTGLKNTASAQDFHLRLTEFKTPDAPYMIINPITTSDFKQWPIRNFAELLKTLHHETPYSLFLIGGTKESIDIKTKLVPGLPTSRIFDLSGQLTLSQLATLLKHSKLLISNDSGPVHMACALGTPTIVLFGDPAKGTHPKRWGPWGEAKHSVIQQTPIDSIQVKDVWKTIQNHL